MTSNVACIYCGRTGGLSDKGCVCGAPIRATSGSLLGKRTHLDHVGIAVDAGVAAASAGLPMDGTIGALAILDAWLDQSFGEAAREKSPDPLEASRERTAALMVGSAFGQLVAAMFGGGWSDDPSAPDDVAAARFVCANGVAIRPLERARVRIREGSSFSLVRYFDATLKALGRHSEDPEHAKSWLAAGETLFSAGRLAAARAAFERANAVGPTHGEASRAIERCDEKLAPAAATREPAAWTREPDTTVDPVPPAAAPATVAPPATPEPAAPVVDVVAQVLDAARASDEATLDRLFAEGWATVTPDAREKLTLAFDDHLAPDARVVAVPVACLIAERMGAKGHAAEAVAFLSVAARRLAPGLPPGPRAELSRRLALVLQWSGPAGHREAVQVLDGTLTMLDGKAAPRDLAKLALTLAHVLIRRAEAPKREDIERAAFVVGRACKQSARDDDPQLWGELQLALGLALRARRGTGAGEAELAFERAAEALSPGTPSWGLAQQGMGVSCLMASGADPAKVDEAIQLFVASLTALGPASADAVRSHYQLGLAYQRRRAGARSDNLDKAIAHYRAALATPNPGAAVEQDAAQDNLTLALRDQRKTTGPR